MSGWWSRWREPPTLRYALLTALVWTLLLSIDWSPPDGTWRLAIAHSLKVISLAGFWGMVAWAIWARWRGK